MLTVRSLNCRILKDVNLHLEPESCLGIAGPSGSGKTTLLSAIAGNIRSDGTIIYQGRDISRLKPWQRPFRYLNQRLYLFPYLTVENNLRLAQYAARQPQHKEARLEMLKALGILHLAGSCPAAISGGEQQRAALARALVSSPRLLLLDEPFSSLDWELREKLWGLLGELKSRFRFSMLLVSHEPKEINALADTRMFMTNGRAREATSR